MLYDCLQSKYELPTTGVGEAIGGRHSMARGALLLGARVALSLTDHCVAARGNADLPAGHRRSNDATATQLPIERGLHSARARRPVWLAAQ
jgi:hypothetical protein